jgi:hypothetical protein
MADPYQAVGAAVIAGEKEIAGFLIAVAGITLRSVHHRSSSFLK